MANNKRKSWAKEAIGAPESISAADACREVWPKAYWDDWMRLNSTRKGRQCIRPEVCRHVLHILHFAKRSHDANASIHLPALSHKSI